VEGDSLLITRSYRFDVGCAYPDVGSELGHRTGLSCRSEGDFGCDGEVQIAEPGWIAIAPPNTSHGVRALTTARAIVIDHPRPEAIANAEEV
jgi:hypothetical protein